MWEQSDVVLTFAAKAAVTACSSPLQQPGAVPACKAEQLCVLLYDVHVARYLTATKLNQQVRRSFACAGMLPASFTNICLLHMQLTCCFGCWLTGCVPHVFCLGVTPGSGSQ